MTTTIYKKITKLYSTVEKKAEELKKYNLSKVADESLVDIKDYLLDQQNIAVSNGLDLEDTITSAEYFRKELRKFRLDKMCSDKYYDVEKCLERILWLVRGAYYTEQEIIARDNLKVCEKLFIRYQVDIKYSLDNVFFKCPLKQKALLMFMKKANPVDLPKFALPKGILSTRTRIAYGIAPDTWLEDIMDDADSFGNRLLKDEGIEPYLW